MLSISKLLIPLALLGLLAACSDEPEAPAQERAPKPTVAEKPAEPAAPPPPQKGVVTASGPVIDPQMSVVLDEVIGRAHRVPQHTARDMYRHPKETLGFFGI